MSFDSLIKSRVIEYLVSEPRLARQRAAAERRRVKGNSPHVVDYFHHAADPYSHLTAQFLHQFQNKYQIELRPHLISGPPDWAAPERSSLNAYSMLDASRLAPKAQILFPEKPATPSPDAVAHAEALLAAALEEGAGFADQAVAIGNALWRGLPLPDGARRDPKELKDKGDEHLADLGHYLGATFYYGGEWYWGIDRLHYLETRLQAMDLARPDAATGFLYAPPTAGSAAQADPQTQIEAFISFRSPYTYLAFDRIVALAESRGATLIIRPVLPMVMRGLAVPKAKTMYILQDAAREARRLNIPFGRICDPLGNAVERGYALVDHAQAMDKLPAFASSFLRGVWSEGIDASTDRGLAKIVDRAGLDWAQSRQHLGDESWREKVEENRKALTGLGLWGVPSFRLGQTCVWGQDRLWVIDDALDAAKSRSTARL